MSNKSENQFKIYVIYPVLVLLVGGFLSQLIPTVNSFTKNLFTIIFRFFGKDICIKCWLLVIFILFSIIALLFLLRWIIKSLVDEQVEYSKYTQDLHKRILWKWDYQQKSNKEMYINADSITPFCPKCLIRMVHKFEYDYTLFSCEHCKKRAQIHGNFAEVRGIIFREIERRIQTGDWRKKP